MNAHPKDSKPGQAIYKKGILTVYDLGVLGISNYAIWKCPTHRILNLYHQNITSNHLDVGVGTGYYLDRCRFPTLKPRIGLLDLNSNSLAHAAHRIHRYNPEVYLSDVMQPIPYGQTPFDSLSMTYLLHCLPGDIMEKGIVFQNLKPLLSPKAVVFGATLLGKGVKRSWAAKKLMTLYNRKGIFSNANDSLTGFRQMLEQHLDNISLEIIGCGVLFVGLMKNS